MFMGERLLRCPAALLSDPWTQSIVTLRSWRDQGALAVRCPAPSAKTLAGLDLLDGYVLAAQREEAARAPDPGDAWEGAVTPGAQRGVA